MNLLDDREIPKGSGRPRTSALVVVGYLALATVAAAATLAVRAALGRPPAGLIAVPERIDHADRPYSEGEEVVSKFRIANPLKQPILIEAVYPGCSCTIVSGDGAAKAGVRIAPGGFAELGLVTTIRPGRDAVQEFATNVVASCGGRPLAPLRLVVSMKVKDPLKAYPQGIQAVGVPAGRPLSKTIVLFTRKGKVDPARLTLDSSDDRLVRGTLVAASSSEMDQFPGGFVTHYKIEATVEPIEPGRSIAASLSVMDGLREVLRLPVNCTAARPYQLSVDRIELEGRPGEVVSTSVYYEANDRAWRGLRAGRSPDGLTMAVEPFDERTEVIRLKATLPERTPAGPLSVSFSAGDGKPTVTIPVVIRVEGGPE